METFRFPHLLRSRERERAREAYLKKRGWCVMLLSCSTFLLSLWSCSILCFCSSAPSMFPSSSSLEEVWTSQCYWLECGLTALTCTHLGVEKDVQSVTKQWLYMAFHLGSMRTFSTTVAILNNCCYGNACGITITPRMLSRGWQQNTVCPKKGSQMITFWRFKSSERDIKVWNSLEMTEKRI